MKPSLLFEIIVTNQCNKRCKYCDLDFRNAYISWDFFDILFEKYMELSSKFEKIHLNFFGGEPMLNFEAVKYGVETFSSHAKYSIGTNGDLLKKEHLEFFLHHNFDVYVSIDAKNISNTTLFELLQPFENILQINFIIEPEQIDFLQENIENLRPFQKIALMPVYTMGNWDDISLKKLHGFFENFVKNFPQRWIFFPYYKGETEEKQYILDTSGKIYQDIDSLLWLQKQYKKIPKIYKDHIEKITHIWNIRDLDLEELLKTHDTFVMEKCILWIEKITQNQHINAKLSAIAQKTLFSQNRIWINKT